jgi:hypothetical protein
MLRSARQFVLDDYKYNHIIKEPEFFESMIPDMDIILNFHNHYKVNELRKLEERRDTLEWSEKNALNEGQQYVGKIIKRLLDINQKYRCTLADDKVDCYDDIIFRNDNFNRNTKHIFKSAYRDVCARPCLSWDFIHD